MDKRLIRVTKAALRSWLLTSGPAFFFVVNPFHARHVWESTTSREPVVPGCRHVCRRFFPGHALHEKSVRVHKQRGVGPLSSSKEQKALLVPQ